MKGENEIKRNEPKKEEDDLINIRQLFRKCEEENSKAVKPPDPSLSNQYVVHKYSLPKGLHAMKR